MSFTALKSVDPENPQRTLAGSLSYRSIYVGFRFVLVCRLRVVVGPSSGSLSMQSEIDCFSEESDVP